MKNHIFTLLFAIILLSCNKNNEKSIENKTINDFKQSSAIESLKLDFTQPTLIDNSIYVMYPLAIRSDGESRGSYSGGESSYWNIIFYNTVTGESHLLEEKRKILIHSFFSKRAENPSPISSDSFVEYLENGSDNIDKYIIYSATILDYNNDGKLDSQDPRYLFISDKAGKNFKQISPDNIDVQNFIKIDNGNKILIQSTKDINNNKKFDKDDETIPMIYDFNSKEYSKEIFDNNFKLKLKNQLVEHWTKKE